MKYTYTLMVAVIALLSAVIIFRGSQRNLLIKYKWLLALFAAAGFLYGGFDFFAVRWGAWFYHYDKTLRISLITEIETHFISMIAAFLAAFIALWQMDKADAKSKQRQTHGPRSRAPRTVWRAAGPAKR